MGSVRRFEEVKHAIGVAAIIGALTGGMGGFLKGVEIFANSFADMAIKEVIESCVATKAGTVLRSLEAIGLPPGERLAYIYDWKTLALDFDLGILIGIGLGSAGIAFKGAAGEAVERAVKEGMEGTLEGAGDAAARVVKESMEGTLEGAGDAAARVVKESMEDTLEGAGDAVARVAKEGMEDTLEGAGDAVARTVKEGTEGVLEDTTERAAKEGLGNSGNTSIISIESFDSWDDMKNAHKGSVTKYVNDNKPLGAAHPKDWLEMEGSSLTIETLENGTQIWYYARDGITVPYVPKIINGELQNVIQFPDEYLHSDKDIACFKVDGFTGDRSLDKKLALEYLMSEGYDQIPKGYALHHDMKME